MPSARYATRWPALFTVCAWLLVAAVVYFSLSRTIVRLPGDPAGHYTHVAAYAVLMFVFSYAYREARTAVILAAGLLALGVGLEYVQSYTGYRTFERADMMADAVGIALGWLVVFGFRRTSRRMNAA
jgi:VanZ family protein